MTVAHSDSHPTLYVVSPWWNRLGSVLFRPWRTSLALPWTTYRVGVLSEYATLMVLRIDLWVWVGKKGKGTTEEQRTSTFQILGIPPPSLPSAWAAVTTASFRNFGFGNKLRLWGTVRFWVKKLHHPKFHFGVNSDKECFNLMYISRKVSEPLLRYGTPDTPFLTKI